MEKLIELLNEYETKTVVHWYEWYGQDVLMCRYIKDNFEFYTDEATTIAISKYYGFIKWLADNDKIDRPKVWLKVKDLGDEYGWFGIYSGVHIECLLMLLAIQDEPINCLTSVLK